MRPRLLPTAFLRWYARRDLFAASARGVTRMTVGSVVVVTAIVTLVMTLALAVPALHRQRLAQSPLAQSLWVGQPELSSRTLTSERLATLDDELTEALPGQGRFDVRAFHKLADVEFHAARDEDGWRRQAGRTVEAGDPFVSRTVPGLDWDRSAPGLFATRALLDALGYSGDEPPPEALRLRLDRDEPVVAVPVLAVVDVDLPYGLTFFLSPEEYLRIHRAGHEPTSTRADTGPVGADWPTYREMLRDDSFLTRFDPVGIGPPRSRYAPDLEAYVWGLEVRNADQPLRRSRWESAFRKLADWLREQGHEVPPEFVSQATPRDLRQAETTLPTGRDIAEVRVASLDDLKAAAVACRAAGYPADESVVQQVEEIRRNSGLFLYGGLVVLTAVLLNAFWNVGVVQSLRCRLKRAEIGMLKAMGVSAGELRTAFLLQAFSLWWRGTLWGLLLGAATTWAAASVFLFESPDEARLLREPFLWVALGTLAVTLVAVVLSVLLGTRDARRVAPMETLRVG